MLDTNVVSQTDAPRAGRGRARLGRRRRSRNCSTASLAFRRGSAGSGWQSGCRLVDELFADRILPFDSAASIDYARIASARERAGAPISAADAVIAATAASAGATSLATRNVSDFVAVGPTFIDPWSA